MKKIFLALTIIALSACSNGTDTVTVAGPVTQGPTVYVPTSVKSVLPSGLFMYPICQDNGDGTSFKYVYNFDSSQRMTIGKHVYNDDNLCGGVYFLGDLNGTPIASEEDFSPQYREMALIDISDRPQNFVPFSFKTWMPNTIWGLIYHDTEVGFISFCSPVSTNPGSTWADWKSAFPECSVNPSTTGTIKL